MKKYSSYKPSGIDWIGEIPESWDKKRLKNLTKSINGFSFKSDDFDREYDIPVIRIGDVSDVIDFDSCVKVKSHFLEDKKDFLIEKDDILIGMTGGTIGKSGRYNYNFPSLLNQRVGLLRNNNLLLNGLLYHYVKSDIFIRYIFYYCYGGGQDNISMNDILNMVIPYPPLQEQEQIVNYLNEKTTIIDKLISTKQRKVEFLKEQRTTLINQVITKGLNPNVKMKDSGLEWIGGIPESWEISKFKYVSEIYGRIGYRGYTIQDIVSEDKGVITISPSNIKNDLFTIEGDNTYISYEKYYQSPEIMIKSEDIILVKTGSTIGKTSIIPKNTPEMTINPQLVVVKNIKIHNKFLYYQTTCDFIKKSFYVEQTGSSTPTISQEKINNFPILKPTFQEQEQIVQYLDKHTKEIDDLVSMEQNKIELLKEYRQSLISEVITGKIKVV
jgi:type I restriction enzyme S subunit